MRNKYRCKLCTTIFPNKRDILNHSCFENNIEVSKDGKNWRQYQG